MDELLTNKLRPKTLSDCLGQKHLIGPNKVLTNLICNNHLFSMILYGKPGIGKTSIAICLVNDLKIRYRMLNATVNDKHDFQVVFEEAKVYGKLVLILDEIHRLNKDKQDLLLPQIESGLIILIGLTTSNPFHSINPAIRSRCHLFELKTLDKSDISEGIRKCIDSKILENLELDNDCINYISEISGNDLRYAYNFLELAYYSSLDKKITLDFLKNINNDHSFFYDKNGDGHYDVLSAFQKSIRGSDVDASLHYLGRLILAGDLDSLFRRLTVICYEDIGLANPSMGPKVISAINACNMLGIDEGKIALSSVVIELALSPKSNSAYLAINDVLSDLKTGRCGDVLDSIKPNSKEYKYPHDYKNGWVKQQYLPNNLKNKKYYTPKETSQHERTLKKVLDNLDKLKKEN